MFGGIAVLVVAIVLVQKGRLGTWGAVGTAMMVTWVCGVFGIYVILVTCWDWISYIFMPK